MPAKIARSAPRPSLGPPELLVAIHTSRQSCSKAGKARIFALVWESSGESRLISLVSNAYPWKLGPVRRLKLWSDVPAASRPACFLFEGGQDTYSWSESAL